MKQPFILSLITIAIFCKKPVPTTFTANDSLPYEVRNPTPPIKIKSRSFGKAKYVLLISVDGLPHILLKHFLSRKVTPNLKRLADRGFFRRMQSVFPSVTVPAHISMITGQYPRHHGVIANIWLENYRKHINGFYRVNNEKKRFARVPNLFYLVSEKKNITAALNWPLTQFSKSIDYNLPELYHSGENLLKYSSKPLNEILTTMFEDYFKTDKSYPYQDYQKKRTLNILTGKIWQSENLTTDFLVRDLMIKLIKQKKKDIPRFSAIHLLTVDTWLHKNGTSPWHAKWAIHQVDAIIGKLIRAYRKKGILEQTAIFITSDHGFLNISYSVDIRDILDADDTVHGRLKLKIKYNGHAAFIYTNPAIEPLEIQEIRRTLKSKRYAKCIEAVFDEKQFLKLGLPRPGTSKLFSKNFNRHPGAPQLIVLTRPECKFSKHPQGQRWLKPISKRKWQIGTHGYLPSHESVMALLLGAGPGIKRGVTRKIDDSEIVDIAPTIAHLMGLVWPLQWPGFKNKEFKLDGRIMYDVIRK